MRDDGKGVILIVDDTPASVSIVETILTEAEINASIEEVEIYADLLLEDVLVNLLDISLRHGQKVTTIQVSTTTRHDELILIWEDDGVGISTTEKELIFERGFGKNTGFGLFFIRDILAITGISIMEPVHPEEEPDLRSLSQRKITGLWGMKQI